MEDRTCPFCGGVQSESRCEICGRPTVKILQQHSAVMTKRYPHPYQEPKQNVQKSAQNHIDNPYLKSIHDKRRQWKQKEPVSYTHLYEIRCTRMDGKTKRRLWRPLSSSS